MSYIHIHTSMYIHIYIYMPVNPSIQSTSFNTSGICHREWNIASIILEIKNSRWSALSPPPVCSKIFNVTQLLQHTFPGNYKNYGVRKKKKRKRKISYQIKLYIESRAICPGKKKPNQLAITAMQPLQKSILL